LFMNEENGLRGGNTCTNFGINCKNEIRRFSCLHVGSLYSLYSYSL